MFAMILTITARVHFALRRLMPTNLVLDAVHARSGLKWGVPAMLLAIPYGLAALWCIGEVGRGGPTWLSLLALLFVWNAMKFLAAGPVAAVRLVSARLREVRVRREALAIETQDVAVDRAGELVDVAARH